jgi:hypothetical protein
MATHSLSIQVVPFGDNADVFINGQHYVLAPDEIHTTADMRKCFGDQPQYVFDALMGLLQDMAK